MDDRELEEVMASTFGRTPATKPISGDAEAQPPSEVTEVSTEYRDDKGQRWIRTTAYHSTPPRPPAVSEDEDLDLTIGRAFGRDVRGA